MAMALPALLAGGGAARAATPPVQPEVAGAWGDFAVAQRDRALPIAGSAAPGATITVTLGAAKASVRADAAGHWQTTLPAQPAATGLALTIGDGATTRRFTEISLGDLFLCSGQSNMELAVSAARDAPAELAHATQPQLRLLHVAHASAVEPQAQLPSAPVWATATPETVRDFSAVCYFFGRELQARLNVPVGLIEAAWGGSNIEAWTPAGALAQAGDYAAPLALNARYGHDRTGAMAVMAADWQRWSQLSAPGDARWSDPGEAGWETMPQPWRNWKEWGDPRLAHYDGLVWFRTRVTLTPTQAAQPATFDTGAIDEEDQTWINGVPVGNSFGWGEPRAYAVPAGTLHPGTNLITLAVYSAWDKGGMFGPADAVRLRLGDGTRLALGEHWQFRQPARNPGAPPHAPWHSIGGLTGMANAMIAPLGPLSVKAVLWYQGESNTGQADAYAGLLDALRRGWRAQLGAETPLLVVQLPGFGARSDVPGASGWATLRDAQRRAVAADPRSALAVVIDTGDPTNLHPTDKQAVAARLVLAARGLLYGEPIAPSGPAALSATRAGASVRITLAGAAGTMVAQGGAPGPFELCRTDQASCRRVAARLEHGALWLDGAATATRVRYCWGDAPVCTLFDQTGRPLTPFELAIE